MLNKKEIIEIAKSFGNKPWQQEKHYIQNIALMELAEHPLVFKGGTYLWFFHGLQRFSEDLDFTSKEKINQDKLIQQIQKTLSNYGIENQIKEMFDDETSTSFRIKAKGPLSQGDQSDCYLYVEISNREKILQKTKEFRTTNPYNLPTKIVSGMSLEEVTAEKVRTILTRTKARDLYDLNYLIGKKNSCSKEFINKKLESYKLDFEYAVFEKKINSYKKIYKKELEPIVLSELIEFQIIKNNILNWAKKIK